MKKILKVIAVISLLIALAGLVFYLVRFSRKHQLRDLMDGVLRARLSGELEDIDGKGVRFVGKSTPENRRTFEAKMALMGFVPIGQYGRSHLYSRDGEEVLVKEITLMHQYVIFEIYNEAYFQLPEAA